MASNSRLLLLPAVVHRIRLKIRTRARRKDWTRMRKMKFPLRIWRACAREMSGDFSGRLTTSDGGSEVTYKSINRSISCTVWTVLQLMNFFKWSLLHHPSWSVFRLIIPVYKQSIISSVIFHLTRSFGETSSSCNDASVDWLIEWSVEWFSIPW